MKKEQVQDLMNAIPPDLIEEADLQAPAKRRLPRAVRTGLIAACLCLALLGTAFAATNPEAMAALIERLTVQISPAETDPGYSVTGGSMTKYPLSAFSPALNAASEGRDGLAVVMLDFDTWEEVQAFLGRDIPCVWPQDWDSSFTVYLFHTGLDCLWGVDIWSTHTTDVVLSSIEVQIRTENWQRDSTSAQLRGTEGAFTLLESYPMANGSTAEIIQYTGTDKHPHANCEGFFMRDGILYNVTTFATVSTADSAHSRLRAALDSFP
ncbi:MAG: hypothetical protein K2P49_00530 [Oscillospiraceae bacterium]|nr:hypothetical protein [Oscillospiraceae bacterium]